MKLFKLQFESSEDCARNLRSRNDLFSAYIIIHAKAVFFRGRVNCYLGWC